MSPEERQRERIRQITSRQFLLDRDLITRDQFVTDADVERMLAEIDDDQQRILVRRVKRRLDLFDKLTDEERTTFDDAHIDPEKINDVIDELREES